MACRLALALLLFGLVLPLPAPADTLIVGNKEADSVGFIDLARGEMVVTRPTGQGPHEVAVSPDGSRAAVVAYGRRQGGQSISLFDIATATPLRVIDISPHSRPHGIVWMPDGRHLLVTAEGSGHLLLVDSEQGRIDAAIATEARGSHMVALAPDARRAFIANLGGDSVSVVDLEARKTIRVVPVGPQTEGIAITPDGRELWVSARGEDRLVVLDAHSLERLAEIATGRIPIRVALSPDGRVAVTSNAGDDSLTVIDTATRKVVATVALDVPEGARGIPVTALFAPNGRRLFVSLTNSGEIAVLDSRTWRQIGRIQAGAGADGLGYAPLALAIAD